MFNQMDDYLFGNLYNPHYSLCDDILTHLKKDERKPITYFGKHLLSEDTSQVEAAINTLSNDGYVIKPKYDNSKTEDENKRSAAITGEGVFFIKLGGYNKKIKKDYKRDRYIDMQYYFNGILVISGIVSDIIALVAIQKKDDSIILQNQQLHILLQKQERRDTGKTIIRQNHIHDTIYVDTSFKPPRNYSLTK
jgi:hypothetical protein